MAKQPGKKKAWNKGYDPSTKYHGSTLSGPGRGAGTEFQTRPWGGDRGNTHGHMPGGMKGERVAPSKASKGHDQSPEKDYQGRTNYGVTDSRAGDFANHTGDYDPRAKSYHSLSGVSGAGHKFRGVRGY